MMNTATFTNTTLQFYPRQNPRRRLFALWYFTTLMILWNILGHTFLGFEQSWATPFVGVGTAIAVSMILEWVDARAKNRPLRFAGSWANFFNFLPACLIAGFACGMLLYANRRLWPIAFAAALSICSKVLLRAPVGEGRTQHIFNPSNFGIALTLVIFPQVGFAPPYHFSENLTGAWDWLQPGIILFTGIIIHALFTGRLPLAAAWVIGFALQGDLRALAHGMPLLPPLTPMTSAAFVVFTLYMIPDPATTPLKPWRQVAFGLAVAAAYGLIQELHLVFGLFFSLLSVCFIRGLSLHLYHTYQSLKRSREQSAAATVGMPAAGIEAAPRA
jgi:enediyne biosynthesis protein E5